MLQIHKPMKNAIAYIFLFLSTVTLTGCDLLKGHGTRLTFGAGEIYYKDGITEAEAKKMGDYLLSAGFFDETEPKSVQLIKREDVYVFRMVTDEAYAKDASFERTISFAAIDFSVDVFNQAKVDVELTDASFKTLKSISASGTRETRGSVDIYRSNEVDESSAKKVSDYLESIGFIGERDMTLSYAMDGDTFVYEMVTVENAENDDEVREANKALAGLISAEVLDNKPVRLHFLSSDFNVKAVYSFGEVSVAYLKFLMSATDSINL